ncbi:MAG TPA: prepilin-type N-terminal cleavage/methylation domain-containing protein [Trueperaceae bacterium]|nr:prepilin-type N-terminal cleavage/methylation domain-containing protein [Trueperaceae bacterium]
MRLEARSSPPPRRSLGVTLLELLVAMAIASLVMISLAGLLATARAGDRALTRDVEPRQALALGAELLREELGMAAFTPYLPAAESGVDLSPPLSNVVVSGASSAAHEVRVSFVDDRLATGLISRDLEFSTGVDGRGEAQLYRRSYGSPRQPLVAGIASLKVRAVIDGAGVHELAAISEGTLNYPAAWALLLELAAPTSETRTFLVELPSRPGLVIEP